METTIKNLKVNHGLQLKKYQDLIPSLPSSSSFPHFISSFFPFLPILTFFFNSIRLALKSQDECALVEEIRTYLKRKAEIEAQYCEDLNALCQQHLAKRKPKQEEK